MQIKLSVAGTAEAGTVTGENLVENDSTMHTDVDRQMFTKIPIESEQLAGDAGCARLVRANTGGNTRTMVSTSACWAIRPSLFQ